MENAWLTYAKRLQALASAGVAYTTNPYDLDRFQQIDQIASEMLAQLFTVPIERIGELAPDKKVYPTPKVDVRGAVIQNGQILLVREKVNGRWTLPGGFAEIGFSAAENVVKEIREEACIEVVARQLYSVRHKAKGPFEPDVRDFYKMYFLCERTGSETPQPGPETTGAAFFSLDALPELCRDRIAEEDLARAFEFDREPGRRPYFD
jgi:ADP-ribose pyrophosphatase YjhB (NUDIX family)